MTLDEALKATIVLSPPGAYTEKVVETLKEAIDCLMIYIKNTTIDCFEPVEGQIYTVSIRSKITKQVDYEKVIEFFKKYNKEEYEKCLNNFTSK